MRILLVDDDPAIRLMLAVLLKPYGDCAEAGSGEDAIRQFTRGLAQQQPFGLVCLDIQMPNLDGHATLRCLRAIEEGFGRSGLAGAKILMATARGTPQDILAAFREQAEGYLVKPIDPVQITAQLEALGLKHVSPL
jgi:two-component system chemotaxis response regulator CheY